MTTKKKKILVTTTKSTKVEERKKKPIHLSYLFKFNCKILQYAQSVIKNQMICIIGEICIAFVVTEYQGNASKQELFFFFQKTLSEFSNCIFPSIKSLYEPGAFYKQKSNRLPQ